MLDSLFHEEIFLNIQCICPLQAMCSGPMACYLGEETSSHLDTLQHLNILLAVMDPKLNTELKVQHHQCRVHGEIHCPVPAGHSVPDTEPDAFGLSGHLDTLLAHV